MIRFVKKLDMWGVKSYEVFIGEESIGCSAIVKDECALPEGQYVLKPKRGRLFVYIDANKKPVGEINIGNGVYNTCGCRMYVGLLIAGVLCIRGRVWLDELRDWVRVTGDRELQIEDPTPSTYSDIINIGLPRDGRGVNTELNI